LPSLVSELGSNQMLVTATPSPSFPSPFALLAVAAGRTRASERPTTQCPAVTATRGATITPRHRAIFDPERLVTATADDA
jgi:hypothetical protein